MSYLKSEPSNLLICKILQIKTKQFKFGTKNILFGYFGTTKKKKQLYLN